MLKQTPQQFAITSWTTHATNPAELIQRIEDLGLKKVQLALVPLLRDPAWAGAKALLIGKGMNIVSGMLGTVGEDYSTPQTIRKTGGFIPDERWEENWKLVQGAAPIAKDLGLHFVSTHAGFLPSDAADPNFAKLVDRISKVAGCFAAHAADVAL